MQSGITVCRTAIAHAALLALCGAAHAQQATPTAPTAPTAPAAEKALAPVTVSAGAEQESPTAPVTGFVAKRALSATKTDTPLIETPQAISVITRDQMEAQGVQTLRQVTAYTAGAVSNYFDSRQDTFKARGGDVTQYLDGMVRFIGYWNDTRPDPYTLERVEFLRGPSSVLYGQGSVGGVLNLTSKRPQAETQREVQVQLGSNARKQLAADMTGKLTQDGEWLYRLVAVGRDSDTQVDHVRDDRLVIAPTVTWKPSAATSLTLQLTHQKDKSGSLIGFFPWQGTQLPNRYGQIPTNTFISEPGWDRYNSESTSWGYLFSHQIDSAWTVRQNLRRSVSDVDYRTLYTSFAANAALGRPARPVFNADNRTVLRDASWTLGNARMLLVDTQVEGKLRWGETEHTVLGGLDVQRNHWGQQSWRAVAPAIDVYNPVYGNFTAPSASALARVPSVEQRQLGFYAQDQIKWGRWTATLGLRHDNAKSDTEGRPAAAADDKAWSKRAGVTYQMDGGWAPYAGYSESFQPLGGVDAYGTPYKPQRGEQWEAGVKWQPPGQGINAFAAVYQLREKNRKTTDPTNPLNSLQIGEVKVKGFEAEVQASLARNWDFTVGYAFTDAKISRSNAGDQGTPVASVPKHTASAWLSHRFASEGRGGWTVGAGVRYTGSQWSGTSAISTPAATLADAMVAYDAGDWRVAFNVVNLADKVHITQCLARGDCFYGQARTYTLTSTYRF
ncbi:MULTISPECIES: TonB-dependent siderophore receptor [Acidovorax]|uniref:TonB-dependent siderophore receptor n=1 Tax=Acidovorax facilis TaxID=12917 RepID=A0ABV8DHS4_9BURK|nr:MULTISPECIES: TonB-dependent siderophore receptor [Acidovorax]KQB58106.1 ligand-gated channel protein [Acidovorax sp. SD340]MBO1011044.1 TonB-dependent siderophore receptor [Acidovorax sp. SD340]MCO4245030.1 TonB-dependent siderophore receptor [Acidovorax facilis]